MFVADKEGETSETELDEPLQNVLGVRIYPRRWKNNIDLRVELKGCGM